MLFTLQTEPLALFEVVLLKEGIAHNLNLASAASRQKFAALLKKLACRIRESRCRGLECCPSTTNMCLACITKCFSSLYNPSA